MIVTVYVYLMKLQYTFFVELLNVLQMTEKFPITDPEVSLSPFTKYRYEAEGELFLYTVRIS